MGIFGEGHHRVQNDGKMLSGSKLTLAAPELENSSSGLVQAVTLLLDVVNAANSGRIPPLTTLSYGERR